MKALSLHRAFNIHDPCTLVFRDAQKEQEAQNTSAFPQVISVNNK